MFAPLPTPEEMAAWDKAAVALGMPEMLLMENAARAAASVLAETFGSVAGRHVLLFMGAGNNGGDAACLARHLHDAGAETLVLHTRPLSRYQGMTAKHLRLARRCGVAFSPAAAWLSRSAHFGDPSRQRPGMVPDVVVDGLLGTGFPGILRDQEARLVNAINELGRHAFILALDIPSGLDGMTGRPSPVAVRASATVSFAAAKPGLAVPEAAPYTGRLRVREIGLPRLVRETLPPSFRLIEADLLRSLPEADAFRHKGDAGHVVVAGGSEGLCGAPHLAALGALRAGAGLVTVAAPGTLIGAIRGAMPDIMSRDLGSSWGPDSGPALAPLLARAQALVVGPGLGRSPEAGQAVASILALPNRPPAVIDADALFALATDPARRNLLRRDDMLTPHPGEAAVLIGRDSAAVQADRPAALRDLIALAPSIWVLKGAGTLIGRRNDPVSLCPLAAPNLAVGGSGDVLAGCMAALVAQRLVADLAACAAVLLHAKAGLWLAARCPHRGNLASEIAAALAEMPRD
jgi:NAD(P)H-hydrate epimerase